MLEVLRFWLERGVDGFRLDTVNYYIHDALLRDNRSPAEEQIRAAMAGNLCRCTGYKAIVAAIEMAAADRDGGW